MSDPSDQQSLGNIFAVSQAAQERKLQDGARGMVNHLYLLYRTAKMHELGNAATLAAMENFRLSLRDCFEQEQPVALNAVGDCFYLNKTFIKVDFQVYENLQGLLEIFKELSIGSIVFSELPPQEVIKEFCAGLIKSDIDPESEKWFGNQRLPGIRVNRLTSVVETESKPAEKVDLGAEGTLLKYYCKTVTAVRTILSKIKDGHLFHQGRLQQVVHDLIDTVVAQPQRSKMLIQIKNPQDHLSFYLVNTVVLSVHVGQLLGLSRKQQSELSMAALFHGIGKLLIPDELMRKPEVLTEEEKRVFKKSNMLSVQLLLRHKGVSESLLRRIMVAFEHSRDVSEESEPISLYSRIVAIIASYEAMTTPKPYRDAMLPSEALQILKNDKKFDPKLLELFASIIGNYPPGILVLLSSNEIAVVLPDVSPQKKDVLATERPIAKIIFDQTGREVDGMIWDLSQKNNDGTYARTIVTALDHHKFNLNPLHYIIRA